MLSALFVLLPVMLMAFSVTQANAWSGDEEEGRLELVLGTPQSRLGVLLGRFGALATAGTVIGVVTLGGVWGAAVAVGFALDRGNLAAASLGMVPLGLGMGAVGYLAAGWLNRAVDTGRLSFLLAGWFLITFVGPGLAWPSAVLHLSALYYYGTPLLNGMALGDTLVVAAVGMLALVGAGWRFMRKDIAG